MEAISTQHLFHSNGKFNIFAWVLFIATLLLVIFAIRQAWAQTQKIQFDDKEQYKKLAELEMNLRTVMGNSYKSVTVPTESIK